MKTNKKSKIPKFKIFDTTCKYKMPMLPLEVGTRRTYENEVPDVEVSIYQELEHGDVKAIADGFQDKWFCATFFDWLLYTKYVKKV